MNTARDQYFKIAKDRQDYKGDRYFRYNPHSTLVTQICYTNGEMKKGRSNVFGITNIHRMTFVSNYMLYSYLTPTTKKVFDDKFKKMVKLLK